MAGIYLHIPFCKQACSYCDFHFSTSLKAAPTLVSAMQKELTGRLQELVGSTINSIYFGGGTPSLLPASDIHAIIALVRERSNVSEDVEITLEANPDDISEEKLDTWMHAGIDRLSMGVQSFDDAQLNLMGRAHNASEARHSLQLLQQAGLRSWTFDLIYGLPGLDEHAWSKALDEAFSFTPPHLSAYCLTIEPRTALYHQVKKGDVVPAEDDMQADHFEMLSQRAEAEGLIHYEISNFGREGHFSRHNTSYWKGEEYIGIGPSAHSFVGGVRRWNIANNARYIKAIKQSEPYSEEEKLTPAQRTSEQLMTGLRTMWGVNVPALALPFDKKQEKVIEHYKKQGLLNSTDEQLILTKAGRLMADRIASDLFRIDDSDDKA